MTEVSNNLRKLVAAEVRNQRQIMEGKKKVTPARMLGLFLEVALNNRGRSRRHFARVLDIEQELADGILDGLLPESELDDDLLVEIARVVKHNPNTLRLMLGRQIVPSRSADDAPTAPASRPPAELNGKGGKAHTGGL